MAIDPSVVINLAAEYTGNKAFKQADTATQKLTKNVKSLAKTFGLAFGTTAVLAYAKASVKAAAADQKAQQQLALALKNVGLGRDAANAESYIQRLQSEFGVVDDLLRPAYQQLAIATRDTAETQRLLGLSLDLSASTGKDLSAVTGALSKAYLGNNTALSKLGVGISKADLKTKSFQEITDQLAKTFKGAASASAATFAGSMAKLGVASENVKEIIGTGIIDALTMLSDDKTVDNLAASMQDLATYTGDVIRGIGVLSATIKNIPGLGGLNGAAIIQAIPILGSYITLLNEAGRKARQISEVGAQKNPIQSGTYLSNQRKITKLTITQTKAAQDSLKLAKAKAIFDLQKIQIEAALKGKISEEDRIRLKLMQAIEDENISQIEKYTKLLDDAQKNTEKLVSTLQGIQPLDDVFKNWNFMSVKAQLASLQTYFNNFAGSAASAFASLGAAQQASLGGYKPFVGAAIPSSGGATTSMPSTVGLGTSGTGNQLPTGITINNNVQTGIGDPNAIAEAIQNVLVEANYRGTLRGLLAI
jgi:hypothetical protein